MFWPIRQCPTSIWAVAMLIPWSPWRTTRYQFKPRQIQAWWSLQGGAKSKKKHATNGGSKRSKGDFVSKLTQAPSSAWTVSESNMALLSATGFTRFLRFWNQKRFCFAREPMEPICQGQWTPHAPCLVEWRRRRSKSCRNCRGFGPRRRRLSGLAVATASFWEIETVLRWHVNKKYIVYYDIL